MNTLRGILSGLGLAAAALCAGCWNPPSSTTPPRSYHTVAAEPLRDTEAAKRHDEAGLRFLANGQLDQAAEAFSRALAADSTATGAPVRKPKPEGYSASARR